MRIHTIIFSIIQTSFRITWANYFDKEGIDYVFFSAAISTAQQEAEALKNSLEQLDLNDASNRDSDDNDITFDVSLK